jgi:hypothetical protein
MCPFKWNIGSSVKRNCTTYKTPSHTQNHETKWPLALTAFETALILAVSLLDAKFS